MRFKNGSIFGIVSVALLMLVGVCSRSSPSLFRGSGEPHPGELNGGDDNDDGFGTRQVHAQIIATGIPGAGAIAQVAEFHRGSLLRDDLTRVAFTRPGQVLDPARLLVASSSNFGAPLARSDEYAGSILSIDPTESGSVAVPLDFAAAGGQASTLAGFVKIYTANSAAFLNRRFHPEAPTANVPGASLPLGISIFNGGGRPWLASAPTGAAGDGVILIADAGGTPITNPRPFGVFTGNVTNRNAASTHGLTTASVATTLITKSPDGTGRAVFAGVNADGSVIQMHTLRGVDGLVPAGTITPLTTITPQLAESTDPHVVTRVGIAFNWVPGFILYVTDPQADRLIAFDLTDDGTVFIASPPRDVGERSMFDIPIDVAPTVPEVGAEAFASNTMLAAGSDLYVLNRGNNTIVRISQDGHLVARRQVEVDGQPTFRANGLGVSPDGRTIWVTGQTENRGGIVVRIDGFGAGPIMRRLMAAAAAQGANSTEALGAFFFSRSFSVDDGVGPLFNAPSCVACHGEPFVGGMSKTEFVTLFNTADKPNQVSRAHAISEIGGHCDARPGVPGHVSAVSRRSTPTLRSTSLIDFILTTDITRNAALEPAAIRGHVNLLPNGRIGKFGWKAQIVTLTEFMGEAFRNEAGLTNGLERDDFVRACGADRFKPELDAVPLVTVPMFLATIDAPPPGVACLTSAGASVFTSAGCAGCHTSSFPGPGVMGEAFLYSDLLLHDMGPELADGFAIGSASGSEFRTMTLVKLSERSHFLHDGRALTPADAIRAHGGQGAAGARAFEALSSADRYALLEFLGCL